MTLNISEEKFRASLEVCDEIGAKDLVRDVLVNMEQRYNIEILCGRVGDILMHGIATFL